MTNTLITLSNQKYVLMKEETGDYLLIDRMNPKKISTYFPSFSLFYGYMGYEVNYAEIENMIVHFSEEDKQAPRLNKWILGGIGAFSASISRKYSDFLMLQNPNLLLRVFICLLAFSFFGYIFFKIYTISQKNIKITGEKIQVVRKKLELGVIIVGILLIIFQIVAILSILAICFLFNTLDIMLLIIIVGISFPFFYIPLFKRKGNNKTQLIRK